MFCRDVLLGRPHIDIGRPHIDIGRSPFIFSSFSLIRVIPAGRRTSPPGGGQALQRRASVDNHFLLIPQKRTPKT